MLITKDIDKIVDSLRQGGIIAYPTEAVYGLGCDPDNESAVLRLLEIKQRPVSKGLILVAADFSQVEKYLKPLTEQQQKFSLPSEITYIYPALETTPRWLTGDFNSLAVRISKHPLVRELCSQFNSALVSTSANLSGDEPAKNAQQVSLTLDDNIDAILDGEIGDLDKPTEIRDSISGQIIRA